MKEISEWPTSTTCRISAVNVTALPVSGRFLAHNHCSPVERAFMAADLFRGATQLVMPTMVQAAHAARVNVTYAWWANRRLAERAAIEAGQIPLAPAKAVNSAKAADWFAQKLTGQTLAESASARVQRHAVDQHRAHRWQRTHARGGMCRRGGRVDPQHQRRRAVVRAHRRCFP